jgi:hypothetical protein
MDAHQDYLRIYMNDQLALGVGWREAAKRAARENEGTPLGDALERVALEIADDVTLFEAIMRRLGLQRNPLKPALAVAAERIGRLKPNGHIRSYSPLSRFIELDLLVMGIEGKKILWQNLRDLAGIGLPDIDFTALIGRADGQRQALEPFRRDAGREVLAVHPGAGASGSAQQLTVVPASDVAAAGDANEPETLDDEPGSVPPVGGG